MHDITARLRHAFLYEASTPRWNQVSCGPRRVIFPPHMNVASCRSGQMDDTAREGLECVNQLDRHSHAGQPAHAHYRCVEGPALGGGAEMALRPRFPNLWCESLSSRRPTGSLSSKYCELSQNSKGCRCMCTRLCRDLMQICHHAGVKAAYSTSDVCRVWCFISSDRAPPGVRIMFSVPGFYPCSLHRQSVAQAAASNTPKESSCSDSTNLSPSPDFCSIRC
jgi:hypothetical protein